jgi:hypothetical protein
MIGPVLRAIDALGVPRRQWDEVTRALGLQPPVPIDVSNRAGGPPEADDDLGPISSDHETPAGSDYADVTDLPLLATFAWTAAGVNPALIAGQETVLVPDPTPPASEARIEPLLAPLTSPGLLAAAVRRQVPTERIDVDAVVDAIARRRLPRRLPRVRRAALPSRLLVLVDTGPAMDPFLSDCAHLVEDLVRMMGEGNVRRVPFAFHPTAALARLPDAERAPGTAVLVVSDLGTTNVPGSPGASPERWITEAASWLANGWTATALVPTDPRRCHPGLRAVLPVVRWDRTTTVSEIATLLRGSRSRP